MYEPFSLSLLRQHKTGYVGAVTAEPAMARRFLDLGIIPGTEITCLFTAPWGDLAAYCIRGAVIALRSRDAAGIQMVASPDRALKRTSPAAAAR
ncbi:MAG: FeoA family protein [Oscillospiraceae bacterium]